ncbi:hypothetical protein Mapa_001596 [Marchantia paleacea]|nr:hypothetical protein Mapa_001596 [Marchantia paleacea]
MDDLRQEKINFETENYLLSSPSGRIPVEPLIVGEQQNYGEIVRSSEARMYLKRDGIRSVVVVQHRRPRLPLGPLQICLEVVPSDTLLLPVFADCSQCNFVLGPRY